MKVRVRYMDGRHWLEPYTDAHAKAGLASMEITESRWLEYQLHMAADREMQRWLLELSIDLVDFLMKETQKK